MIDATRFVTRVRPMVFACCRSEDRAKLGQVEVAAIDASTLEFTSEDEIAAAVFTDMVRAILTALTQSTAIRFVCRVIPQEKGIALRLRWAEASSPIAPPGDDTELPRTGVRKAPAARRAPQPCYADFLEFAQVAKEPALALASARTPDRRRHAARLLGMRVLQGGLAS